VVDLGDQAPVITLFSTEPIAAGQVTRLEADVARHAHVRRVSPNDAVRLLNGRGRVGAGRIESLGKHELTIVVDEVTEVPRPPRLEVLVPVADRDRMLWAAEKCVELQITAWRPVMFARSRSVSPRGEGSKFLEKVRARMQSALEQSGGAWLADVHAEVEPRAAWSEVNEGALRLLLDVSGRPISTFLANGPAAIAVGPEGGWERSEVDAARELGWVTASLARSTLRFETAVVAGAAVIRAMQL
jgi:16S rRNA (uracil1498-N3)-methyltransferase